MSEREAADGRSPFDTGSATLFGHGAKTWVSASSDTPPSDSCTDSAGRLTASVSC